MDPVDFGRIGVHHHDPKIGTMPAEPVGRQSLGRGIAVLLLLVAGLAPLGGCLNNFADQVEVPGTNQRIIVGHDGWPNRKAWVLEGDKLHRLKFVRK